MNTKQNTHTMNTKQAQWGKQLDASRALQCGAVYNNRAKLYEITGNDLGNLLKQRDELLAALKGAFPLIAMCPMRGHPLHDKVDSIIENARAAIANVEANQ